MRLVRLWPLAVLPLYAAPFAEAPAGVTPMLTGFGAPVATLLAALLILDPRPGASREARLVLFWATCLATQLAGRFGETIDLPWALIAAAAMCASLTLSLLTLRQPLRSAL